MVDAIISLAVQKLDGFLSDEVALLQGVREDVEWLKQELRWMQSFIKDGERCQDRDNRLQQWISNITEVANETVHVLETYSLRVEDQDGEAPKRRIIDYLKAWCKIPNETKNLSNIGTEIKSLREKLQEISRRRNDYGTTNFGDGGEGTSAGLNNRLMRQLRKTTSYINEDHVVVGFEDEANKLLAELLKEDHRRCVVSIYGMGGLGKTTLAQKLYHSPKVRGKFDCQAWVCVSQEYNTEDLLRSIIKSFKRLTREEFDMVEKMKDEDLERYLREFLERSSYLVVLDDVWDKGAWKILKRAFPDRSNGSRVIITTRNRDVAVAEDGRTFIHKLRFLTMEESWDLFCKKAFPRDGEVNCRSPAKKELGKEMVGKCTGLPLAIIVLGGLLLHKKQLEEWSRVKEHIWRHLRNDSIEISELLSLSYYDLSDQMKPCYLYLGMYPEDCNIEVKKLMFLWIAEGFIPNEEGRMEDVAEEYLNELINRSLIQVTSQEFRRNIRCKVHDLLLDLAIKKAKEVNFFDIYDPRKYSASLLRCPRHAVHSHFQSYFSLDHSNSKLFSLLFFNPNDEHLENAQLEFIWANFKSLRVLDLKNVKFRKVSQLPDMVGELIHLKFLWLPPGIEVKLPPSIGNLKYLRVLDAYSSQLPVEICNLKQLRYIHAQLLGNLRMENLTNLHTLRFVDYEQWLEIDTVKLINLRNLGIRGLSKLENATYSLESLAKLKSLEDLDLQSGSNQELPPLQPLSSCQHLFRLCIEGRIEKLKLPPINELPQRLEVLMLSNSELEEDPMPTLERLPNLTTLRLSHELYKGKKMVCTAGGFSQLEELQLFALNELEELQVEEGAMPNIRTFVVDNCPNLKMLPEKLKSISSS